jgi:hypothetical protein
MRVVNGIFRVRSRNSQCFLFRAIPVVSKLAELASGLWQRRAIALWCWKSAGGPQELETAAAAIEITPPAGVFPVLALLARLDLLEPPVDDIHLLDERGLHA